ncbi:lipopolysaccharide biosynthesis protein [Alteromonas pelagimontana]|uniref:Lipopolysaccharide biosynthesis protein n=1 Tax=Alteromonas pelagimontana TaxID=1858656 RepID=A0A6M4MDG8_9ALTE|nr:lipopolysaccharide biosynthesis protein [Alteromonas pelagimontana]QJR80186.1 lipopolysaccharide biosynthesis protein [Alteromonas pelagimontana]
MARLLQQSVILTGNVFQPMSLKAKSIAGAFFSLSANGFAQIINFIVYAIMARILGVEEFGLVAICLMVVEFCNLFVTVGISQNLIQRKEWDNDFASLSFWVLMVVSAGIAALIFAVAVPIAYYTYSELAAQLIAALAIIPISNGFRLIHKSKLEREFQNKKLAAYDTAGVIIGGIVSVVTALQGFGAWAIIYGKVAQSVVSTALTCAKSDFRPQKVKDKSHLPEIISFSKPLIAMSFVNFFSQKTSNIVIAFFLGAATFAYSSVARQGFSVINNLTFQPLNRIALAGLARVDELRLKKTFNRIVSMTAIFVTPIYFGIGAVAHPFIDLVFGDKWTSSAYLLSILAIMAPTQVMAYYLPNLLISRGLPGQAFKLNMINLVVNMALPIMAVPWGLYAVIVALVVANYVTVILKFNVVKKHLGIGISDAIKHTWMFSLAGFTMFASVLYLERMHVLPITNVFLELAALVGIGAIIYGLILLLFFRQKTFSVIGELKRNPMPKKVVKDNQVEA